jgi:hypothetical protein
MCLIVLIGAAFPRVALFLTWVFTDRVSIAFDNWYLPFLGFLLLPFTTFFYVLAYAPVAGVHGIGWFFVAFGFFLDLANWTSSGRYGQQQYATH